MPTLDQPKLRSALSGREITHQGERYIQFQDEAGAFDAPVLVPSAWYHHLLRHFDGHAKLADHQARVLKETGQVLPADRIKQIVTDLDKAMLLDGPTYAEFIANYRASRHRPSSLAGRSYAGTERALRAQLSSYFTHPNGAGEFDPDALRPAPSDGSLRGILSPHIDFQRGGPVYSWPYKELVERSDADVFVIFGVAHKFCELRFALTYKDFETPLGLARTDREFVDQIVSHAGDHLFEDEIAHRSEHSIEFQVVLLQYLLGERRDYAIVPILVGSFHDLMQRGVEPSEDPEVKNFIEAVRHAEGISERKVCYIGGIDLSHVGPEFGDSQPVSDATLGEIRSFDQTMLGHATRGDASSWFQTAAAVQNKWRVCGLAATYTMLHTMGPTQGRLLRYDQSIDDQRRCCVTFAGVAYDADGSRASEV